MQDSFIKYRSGYKYQLDEDYKIQINIKPQKGVDEKFIKLDQVGNLIVVAGYAWDGPSGPVIDTKENMRASLWSMTHFTNSCATANSPKNNIKMRQINYLRKYV